MADGKPAIVPSLQGERRGHAAACALAAYGYTRGIDAQTLGFFVQPGETEKAVVDAARGRVFGG